MWSITNQQYKFPVIKRVKKVWGEEQWIVNEKEYCAKLLLLDSGYQCSLHAHVEKKETFNVLEGSVFLEVIAPDDPYPPAIINIEVLPGQRFTIDPGWYHRFSSKTGAIILEVSTHHDDTDVIRKAKSGPVNEQELERRIIKPRLGEPVSEV